AAFRAARSPALPRRAPWGRSPSPRSAARFRAASPAFRRRASSERDREQRIEARTVAHHDAFGEFQAFAFLDNLVEIASGGKEVHLSVPHDAHHEEWRFGRLALAHRGQADDVAVALALVDIGLAEPGHAVLGHRARSGADQA